MKRLFTALITTISLGLMSCGNNFSNANTYFHYGFEAGFDCRDKLAQEEIKALKAKLLKFEGMTFSENEALKIAVKVLRDICDYEDYEDNTFKIARSALAEIRKLRGEE